MLRHDRSREGTFSSPVRGLRSRGMPASTFRFALVVLAGCAPAWQAPPAGPPAGQWLGGAPPPQRPPFWGNPPTFPSPTLPPAPAFPPPVLPGPPTLPAPTLPAPTLPAMPWQGGWPPVAWPALPQLPSAPAIPGIPGWGAPPAPAPASGDVAGRCVDDINRYRATKNLSPLARWTSAEGCATGEAQTDAASQTPHGSFGHCGESAQNACPPCLPIQMA